MATTKLFSTKPAPVEGLEIPHKDCGNCRVCGSELGYFLKPTKDGESLRKVFWFSNKQHKNLNTKRIMCIDCFKKKESRLPKQPNMPTYDLCSLLGVSEEEVSKLTKARAVTKEALLERYGEVDGTKRWESYCNRQAYTASTEYFVNEKGMAEEEALEFHRSRATTLENLIRRHGEEVGKEKYEAYKKAQEYTKSLQRYIDEFGEVEGTKKFNKINNMKCHDYHAFIAAGLSEEEAKRKHEIFKTRAIHTSTVANTFFEKLCDTIGVSLSEVYFASSTKGEYVVEDDMCKHHRFDFVDNERGLCIEFHGDYWHFNPKIYKPTDFNIQSKKTAQQIWDNDIKRKELIESKGFKLEVVWESEYNKDCELIIQNIKRKYYGHP